MLAGTAVALGTLAGCITAPGGAPGPTASGSPSPSATDPGPGSAVLASLAGTVVVTGFTPQQRAVEVSERLFRSAPIVVVVRAGDESGTASGARQAERLGVPLLLAEDRPATSPAAPSSNSSSAPSSASPPPSGYVAEIRRLGATTVVSVDGAADGDIPGVTVLDDGTRLSAPTAAPPGGEITVLFDADGDPAAPAITATARAAGATVVGVRGGDPRADEAAIAALAKHPPRAVLAVGERFAPAERLASRVAVAATGVQLPGGGQVMFPGRRLVALYGHPGAPSLGVLGEQGIDATIARAREHAAAYQPLSDVPVVPTFEIIATVAQRAAGRDGDYSGESTVASLRPWIDAADKAGIYVVLDLQVGRADPLAQAKLYTELLERPNVGLAVDPEWALGPTQLPLQQIGSLDSSQLNAVGAWLDQLTAAHHLPQKLYVIHQFRLSMIGNEAALRTDYDNVAVLIHMDGQGTPATKDATWAAVTRVAPKGVPFGWKNFYDEDHPMLSEAQTMAKRPQPLMISYQ